MVLRGGGNDYGGVRQVVVSASFYFLNIFIPRMEFRDGQGVRCIYVILVSGTQHRCFLKIGQLVCVIVDSCFVNEIHSLML